MTRLYGAFEEGPRVKIFPNESFGFLRITVERPLQLRWEITDDTLTAVAADKKVAKLPVQVRDLLVDKLRANNGADYHTEKAIKAVVQDALVSVMGTKPTALVNAVTADLAVRDPDAAVITDRKGNPKPDPTLTGLRERPTAHQTGHLRARHRRSARHSSNTSPPSMTTSEPKSTPTSRRLARPKKTKIGYEIPLTRHFYTYTPPRPLQEIDAEIKSLEDRDSNALLTEVTEVMTGRTVQACALGHVCKRQSLVKCCNVLRKRPEIRPGSLPSMRGYSISSPMSESCLSCMRPEKFKRMA